MEPSMGEPMLNSATGGTGREQLRPRNHSMLSPHQRPDLARLHC
jgi:hypothetical protein